MVGIVFVMVDLVEEFLFMILGEVGVIVNLFFVVEVDDVFYCIDIVVDCCVGFMCQEGCKYGYVYEVVMVDDEV